MKTPVSVFTGFLGSGKTTLILNILKALPEDYKVCILKNEYGDSNTDAQLIQQQQKSALGGVKEITNGCLCCVLVGQMKEGLLELLKDYKPDRILIECSGSAFPAPIAWQIRELEKESDLYLDSIVTVVDCLNFNGYEDQSYTARLQAQYTDLIILTKHEEASLEQIDSVLDKIGELNPETAVVKYYINEKPPLELLFNLDAKQKYLNFEGDQEHMQKEVDYFQIQLSDQSVFELDWKQLEEKLSSSKLDKEYIYRVKGIISLKENNNEKTFLLNWAFGRFTLTETDLNQKEKLNLTIIGVHLTERKHPHSVKDYWIQVFKDILSWESLDIKKPSCYQCEES